MDPGRGIRWGQPTKRNIFFVITSSPGNFYEGSCEIALNSTTRRHPRRGLVSGSRGPMQTHIRGLSVTGPVSRRATSALSHRADDPPGPQAPAKQARLVHTDRTDRSGRGARMQCPGASVLCLSPPLVVLLLKRLAIRSGQSHPQVCTRIRTSPVAVEEPPSSRDPATRPLRRSPRHP